MEYKFNEGQPIVHAEDLYDAGLGRCDPKCLRRGVVIEQIEVAGPAYWVEWQNEYNKGECHIFAESWLIEDKPADAERG